MDMKNNIIPSKELIAFENKPFDFNKIIFILQEKKKTIFSITFVILLTALLYTFFKPITYQASILLQISHKQTSNLGFTPEATKSVINNSPDAPVAAQIALIRSKFILSPVIQSLHLDIEFMPVNKNILAIPDNSLQIKSYSVPAHYLNKKLTLVIYPQNKFFLYHQKKLLYQGKVNQDTKEQNGFLLVLTGKTPINIQNYTLIKHNEASIMRSLLSHMKITDLTGLSGNFPDKAGILQISLSGNQPANLIKTINAIATITQVKDAERKSLEAKNALLFLQQQLIAAQESLRASENLLNQYRAKNGKITIALQIRYLLTDLSDIDKQLEKIKLKKIDLLEDLTPLHPNVIALNQKLQRLELQRNLLLEKIRKLSTAEQTATELMHDVAARNNLYMTLLNRIHEQKVIAAGVVSDIGILALATSADSPAPPAFFLIIFASIIAGLFISCTSIITWRLFTQQSAYAV